MCNPKIFLTAFKDLSVLRPGGIMILDVRGVNHRASRDLILILAKFFDAF